MIVSGAPERTPDHAIEILNMAFEMLEQINSLRNPVTGKAMMVRIGKQLKSTYRLNYFYFKFLRCSYRLHGIRCCRTSNASILPIWRNCEYS